MVSNIKKRHCDQYAQEILQTFSLSLGEVALIPSTSGTFVITLLLPDPAPAPASSFQSHQQRQRGVAAEEVKDQTAAGNSDGGAAVVSGDYGVGEHVLWDRKTEGGFPETKELKRRIRDLVQPGRGLGHVDRDYGKGREGGRRSASGGKGSEEKARLIQDEEDREGEKEGDSERGKDVKAPKKDMKGDIGRVEVASLGTQVDEKCEDCTWEYAE